MKAVILAGGFATRLRPLSLARPKQLFPIANRPLLSYILENLSRHSVGKAILAVNYKAEKIRLEIGEKYGNMKIEYSREKTPLGTGGPIKQLEKELGDEPYFIVMNGDIIADIDVTKILDYHVNQRDAPAATIALVKVKDPSRFGMVETTPDGRVKRFIEKPSAKPGHQSWINGGLYVLSKKFFEYLKPGPSSIERDVFPVLAKEGLLQSFRHRDYWSDVGKPEDYLAANIRALDTLGPSSVALSDGCAISGPVNFIPPVLLGAECHIQRGSSIGPYVVLGRNVEVGPSCKLSRSIVFDKSIIKSGTWVSDSLIGESVLLGEKLRMAAMSIVADRAKITTALEPLEGVVVQPGQEIK